MVLYGENWQRKCWRKSFSLKIVEFKSRKNSFGLCNKNGDITIGQERCTQREIAKKTQSKTVNCMRAFTISRI